MSKQAIDGLKRYSNRTGYEEMNTYLRSGKNPPNPALDREIAAIAEGMQHAGDLKCCSDPVYRGATITHDKVIEMIEAGLEPEIPYYRYQMDVRGERPVFSEEFDELVAMLIEDVMDLSDCQSWDEMKYTELEDWYTWNTFADS